MFDVNENDFHIYLVAQCQWLALLFRKLPLQIIHLEITIIRNTEYHKAPIEVILAIIFTRTFKILQM